MHSVVIAAAFTTPSILSSQRCRRCLRSADVAVSTALSPPSAQRRRRYLHNAGVVAVFTVPS
eukprot:4602503-Pleurochrysis_carterae.AAC.1